MDRGLIHLYCGDGKGKTTAAMGLALRALGRGRKVLVAQFLKSSDSGERLVLDHLDGVTLLETPEEIKFTYSMNEEERSAAAIQVIRLMDQVEEAVRAGKGDLVILDEVCAAVGTGLLLLKRMEDFLDGRPAEVEVVMTGRNPAPALMRRADYVTEMRKIAHPYDDGIAARRGIEF